MKEERVLFPAIHALDSGRRDFPFGSVANPIRMMGIEHDRAGELLAELRVATSGYAVAGGCKRQLPVALRAAGGPRDGHAPAHPQGEPRAFPAALRLAEA
jgi:hypothetical protein